MSLGFGFGNLARAVPPLEARPYPTSIRGPYTLHLHPTPPPVGQRFGSPGGSLGPRRGVGGGKSPVDRQGGGARWCIYYLLIFDTTAFLPHLLRFFFGTQRNIAALYFAECHQTQSRGEKKEVDSN